MCAHNGPGNLLVFGTGIGDHDISCLLLMNNSCRSDIYINGFIAVKDAVLMATSIFVGNRFDFLVGTGTVGDVAGSITFFGCVFDFVDINTTGTVTAVVSHCFSTNNAMFDIQRCPWPLPSTPGRTTGQDTDDGGLGMSLVAFIAIIAGSVVGGALITCVAVIAVLRSRAKSHGREYSPESGSGEQRDKIEEKVPMGLTEMPPPTG
jgi:hypothetical protein